jgi:hypothetical protein
VRIVANLADDAQSVALDGAVGAVLLASDEATRVDRIGSEAFATSGPDADHLHLPAESVAIARMASPTH